MIFRRLLVAFSSALFLTTARAAPLERDLGQGLGYVRLKQLPADLPAGEPGRAKASVLDARYVAADGAAAMAFGAWLKFRATARTPVFVLVNADTSPALRAELRAHDPAGGIVVIGVATAQFRPDSAVAISPQDERRAYDALAEGTTVEALLTDNPGKVRNDEASLAKGQPNDPPPVPAELPVDAPPAKRNGPPVDVALQRAIHLHRALVALKRL